MGAKKKKARLVGLLTRYEGLLRSLLYCQESLRIFHKEAGSKDGEKAAKEAVKHYRGELEEVEEVLLWVRLNSSLI